MNVAALIEYLPFVSQEEEEEGEVVMEVEDVEPSDVFGGWSDTEVTQGKISLGCGGFLRLRQGEYRVALYDSFMEKVRVVSDDAVEIEGIVKEGDTLKIDFGELHFDTRGVEGRVDTVQVRYVDDPVVGRELGQEYAVGNMDQMVVADLVIHVDLN